MQFDFSHICISLRLLFLLLLLNTLPVFSESSVTNHSGTDVWDAGWRQRCTAGFRCESYTRGHPHIYHNISCVNTANCQKQNYMKNFFPANGVALSPLKGKGGRGHQCNTKKVRHCWYSRVRKCCLSWFLGYQMPLELSIISTLLRPSAQQAVPPGCVNEVILFGWECKPSTF